MTVQSETHKSTNQDSEGPGELDFWIIWFVAWVGITVAGGVFGLIAGSIPGLMMGPILAAVCGVPLVITFALLTWALWLSRFLPVSATLAGACTGIVSTACVWEQSFLINHVPLVLLAGCIGGTVSGFVTYAYWRKRERPSHHIGGDAGVGWQYSLRDLFLRFTVVTVLIAVWSLAIAKFFT